MGMLMPIELLVSMSSCLIATGSLMGDAVGTANAEMLT